MENYFRRQVIASIVAVAGAFLVFGAALYFVSSDLDKNSNRVYLDRTAAATRSAALESLAALKSGLNQSSKYRQAMSKILVTQDQLIDFPRWLGRLAQVNQVSENASFQGSQSAPQGKTPGYIGFGMSASGPWGNLSAFLKDVEYRYPQFLVNFDTVDLTQGNNSYSILVNGRVFFEK